MDIAERLANYKRVINESAAIREVWLESAREVLELVRQKKKSLELVQEKRAGSSSSPPFDATATANSLVMSQVSEHDRRSLAAEHERELVERLTKPNVIIPSRETAEKWKSQWEAGKHSKL